MEELARERDALNLELQETIKREEVLIAVLSTLNKKGAADLEGDLRIIRTERMELVHKLNDINNKIKMLS